MARRRLALARALALLGLGDRGAGALATRVRVPLLGTRGKPARAPPAPPTLPRTPTPSPDGPAAWRQCGAVAQRSGAASEGDATPWRLRWQSDGAAASGHPQASHLSAPDLVQPITGGGRVYVVAAN